MDTGLTREILHRRIEDQMALAALATDDAVRAWRRLRCWASTWLRNP
jgi:hypothetical protein